MRRRVLGWGAKSEAQRDPPNDHAEMLRLACLTSRYRADYGFSVKERLLGGRGTSPAKQRQ
jgi:hypothetical protein